MAGDAIGQIVLDVIKGVLWVTMMLVVGLYNLLKTPPLKKLQRLTPKEGWGDKIEGVVCVRCQTENQYGRTHCFACGQEYRYR